jgi:hypothetical protein
MKRDTKMAVPAHCPNVNPAQNYHPPDLSIYILIIVREKSLLASQSCMHMFKICYKAVEAPPLLLLLLPARSEYSATNFAKHDDLSLRSLLGMSYSDTLPEVPINPEPRSVSCQAQRLCRKIEPCRGHDTQI